MSALDRVLSVVMPKTMRRETEFLVVLKKAQEQRSDNWASLLAFLEGEKKCPTNGSENATRD